MEFASADFSLSPSRHWFDESETAAWRGFIAFDVKARQRIVGDRRATGVLATIPWADERALEFAQLPPRTILTHGLVTSEIAQARHKSRFEHLVTLAAIGIWALAIEAVPAIGRSYPDSAMRIEKPQVCDRPDFAFIDQKIIPALTISERVVASIEMWGRGAHRRPVADDEEVGRDPRLFLS